VSIPLIAAAYREKHGRGEESTECDAEGARGNEQTAVTEKSQDLKERRHYFFAHMSFEIKGKRRLLESLFAKNAPVQGKEIGAWQRKKLESRKRGNRSSFSGSKCQHAGGVPVVQ